jgi:hypothetical protein
MGLDYIRRATGKPWRKRWARSLEWLKTPTLLDSSISERAPTVTASFEPFARPKLGDTFVVQIFDNTLVVFDGLRAVALARNPPASIVNAIAERCGIAEARVERVGIFGDTAELRVR